jgi:predicted ATP-grasp superfamily ATP-dependent carboligase
VVTTLPARGSPRLRRGGVPDVGTGWRRPPRRAGRRSEGPLDALVLDAQLRQGLVSIRSLGRAGLDAAVAECESEPLPASWSRWCRGVATLPDRADPHAFVDGIEALLAERPAQVLIPTHDGSIDAIRAHRAELDARVAVALAPPAPLALAIDKARTLEVATEAGLSVPRSAVVTAPGDARAALSEIGLPAVVKPLTSWLPTGRRVGARAVISLEEGEAALAHLLAEGSPAVVQQWVPGRREAVSVLYADGRLRTAFAQVAPRMNPVLGGASVVRESVSVPTDTGRDSQRLVEAMELDGYAEVEFRRDDAGRPWLMEVNPRLSAAVEVAVRAGVPFPLLVYRWAAGEPIEPQFGYRTGVRVRWLGGDVAWLAEALRTPGRPDVPLRRRALGTFVRDFARPASYDYLDAGDLAPAVVATTTTLRAQLRRVGRRLVGR